MLFFNFGSLDVSTTCVEAVPLGSFACSKHGCHAKSPKSLLESLHLAFIALKAHVSARKYEEIAFSIYLMAHLELPDIT